MEEPISPSEALRGFRLTLSNAEALLEEARILLAADHPARAIALAVLAMEEVGKLPGYAAASRYAERGRWRQWWRMFRRHTGKLAMHEWVRILASPKDLDTDDVQALLNNRFGETWHQVKLSALYTDFRSGEFVSPLDLPEAEALAQAATKMVEETLPIHRFIGAHSTPELFDKVARQSAAWEREATRQGKSVFDAAADEATDLLTQILERGKPREDAGRRGP